MAESKLYELMLMLVPDRTEAQQKKHYDALKKEIEKLGGTIEFEDVWGFRDLAYKIDGYTQGYYIVVHTKLPKDKVREYEDFLRIERGVMRHLLTIPPLDYTHVSYKNLQESEKEQLENSGAGAVERYNPQEVAAKREKKEASSDDKVEYKTSKPAPSKADEDDRSKKEISEDIDQKLSKIIDEDVDL